MISHVAPNRGDTSLTSAVSFDVMPAEVPSPPKPVGSVTWYVVPVGASVPAAIVEKDTPSVFGLFCRLASDTPWNAAFCDQLMSE